MQGLTRRWLRRDAGESASSSAATPEVGSDLLSRLLAARGLTDPDAVRRFREPSLHDLHEPGLLPGVERAAERLAEAIRKRQRIVIYGDYDVDGITASTVLHHMLTTADPDVDVHVYIPHRIDEGYGMNADAVAELARQGADVIVSVDCGITAVEPARVAREAGVDLIITDHHNLPADGVLPEATAVVHPNLPGHAYPFSDLCGAGVAFKLAWQFAVCWCGSQRVGEAFQQGLMNQLPLVALGTIADVVPLLGENRVLASYGLRIIRQTPIVGLRALIEASELMDEQIDCQKVGFVLGPRLNACGRMGHAAEAVRMLITDDPAEARAIADQLTAQNRKRQQTERQIADHAARLAESLGMTGEDRRAIVLADDDWHPGVVGIVCSRLVELFGRPTILMQRQGDLCKGSGRSIDGYSIHGALSETAEYLSTYGGHDAAAGLSLPTDRLEAFTEAFIAHANANIPADHLMPAVHIDCDTHLHELDFMTVSALEELAPFGRDNPRPAVRLKNVTLAEAPRQMGSQGKHLDLKLRSTAADGAGDKASPSLMRAVWWRQGGRAADLAPGMPIEAIVEPKISTWAGRTRVEAVVRDLRPVAASVRTPARMPIRA